MIKALLRPYLRCLRFVHNAGVLCLQDGYGEAVAVDEPPVLR